MFSTCGSLDVPTTGHGSPNMVVCVRGRREGDAQSSSFHFRGHCGKPGWLWPRPVVPWCIVWEPQLCLVAKTSQAVKEIIQWVAFPHRHACHWQHSLQMNIRTGLFPPRNFSSSENGLSLLVFSVYKVIASSTLRALAVTINAQAHGTGRRCSSSQFFSRCSEETV